VFWLVTSLLVIIVLYVVVPPLLAKPEPLIENEKVNAAILLYAQTQLPVSTFELPEDATKWKVQSVKIHKLDTLPGVQGNQKAAASIIGSYYPADQQDLEEPLTHEIKLNFTIGKKYPEGISVQLAKF
ncbi:MAG: hypothetical protein PHO32_04840, partial [Candidatus Cloacimonetes bacterium]|nr:hypothetical protein [Candidatus Cloacimonadota bacterium]